MIPGFFAAATGLHVETKPWTPSVLAVPPALWLNDDSQLVTGGSSVESVGDLSQRRLDVLQPDLGARPTVSSTQLNGRRILEFDGTQWLDLDPEAGNIFRNVVGGWAFAVYKLTPGDVSNTERPLFGLSIGTSSGFRFGITASPANGTNTPAAGGRRLDSDSYHGTQGAARAEQWVLLFGSVDYVSRTIRLHVNGDLEDEATNQFTASGPSSNTISLLGRIGANFVAGTPTTFFRGQIAEIVVGQGVLDQADVDRLFGYAAHRWALDDLLDAGHPYKSSPPMYAPPSLYGFPAVLANSGTVALSHRGGALLYPEHTDAAYAESVLDGEPCIEQDVYLTADGSPVCTHDSTATYVTTSTAAYSTLTDAQVAALVVDSEDWHGSAFTGLQVPLYASVVGQYIDQLPFVTEGKTAAANIAVTDYLESEGVPKQQVMICGSHIEGVTYAAATGRPTMLTSGGTNINDTVEGAGITYAGYSKNHNPGFMANAISRGIPVLSYTTNRRHEFRTLAKQGVSGVWTDDPIYIRSEGPIATEDTFAAGHWMPGMIAANTPDESRPLLSARGRMIAPDYWGWTDTADTIAFVLQGWACPIKSDPGASDFAITLKARIDSEPVNSSRWIGLYIADESQHDRAYNNESAGNSGYAVLLRRTGVLEIWRHDPGGVSLIDSVATGSITLGVEVPLRVTVSASHVTAARLDGVGDPTHTVSIADTTYRGGYFHLGKRGVACRFREIVVS